MTASSSLSPSWPCSRAVASHRVPFPLSTGCQPRVIHHKPRVGSIIGIKPSAGRLSSGRRTSSDADTIGLAGASASPDVRVAQAPAAAAATAGGAARRPGDLQTGSAVAAEAAVAHTGPEASEPARLSRRRLVRAAAAVLLGLLAPATPQSGEGMRAFGSSVVAAAELSSGAGDEVFAYVAPEPLDGTGSTAAEAMPPTPPAPRHFRSLEAAVAACPAGGVVLVAAGRYRERLLLSRPVTLRAWPRGARVEVVWETTQPYESTLDISSPPPHADQGTAGRPPTGSPSQILGTTTTTSTSTSTSTSGGGGGGGGDAAGVAGAQVVVEGLTIRHSSKSVANNYGVYIRGGSPRLVDCDISSATGAGVGVEGANPQLLGCRVHDCARQGIAIFGASLLELDPDLAAVVDPGLMYGMSGGSVQGCDVYGNALDGVLVRNGASPDLLDNLVHNNGGVGVNLQDASGRYERNTVYDNARGAVAISALFELDPGDLAGSNSLKGLVRRL